MRARAAALALAPLIAAGAARAQEEPQYFSPPAAPAWELRWDALVRYDAIDLARQQAYAANIYRWRTEVRPEADWMPSEGLRFGVRLLGELSSDANATNDRRLDNYRSNDAAVDRAFVQWQPGPFSLTAGKFELPVEATEILWDHDIQPIGAAGRWRAQLSAQSALTLASAFFYGPQREHDQSHIAVAQATLALGESSPVSLHWSEAYWRFSHLDGTARRFLRQNDGYGAPPEYASDYRILDSLVRGEIAAARIPVSLSIDWVHNFGAYEKEYADGIEAALKVGPEGAPGDVQVFDIYQMVDRDAVVGAYNTDDWWFHSWYVGHRVGVSVTLAPMVELRPSVVFQRRQDRQHYLNRYLIDLVKTF